MPDPEEYSEDYLAKVLKEDARASSIKYSTLGLQAFLPKRATGAAPKPNTRFLLNILRETDSHNAALLAKEKREARERERALNKQDPGRLSPVQEGERNRVSESSSGAHRKRVRDHGTEDEERRRHRKHRRRTRSRSVSRSRSRSPQRVGRDHGARNYESKKRRRDDHTSGKVFDSDLSPEHRQERHRRKRQRDKEQQLERETRDGHRKSRSRSRSRSRTKNDRSRHSKASKQRSSRSSDSTNPSPVNDLPPSKSSSRSVKKLHRGSSSQTSDSDPLEALIGPSPPKSEPKVKAKGRGAFHASSAAMDSHFASNYDPSVDVQPDPESEHDWELALEAMRDRQKWKQQGAARLRSAGFSEIEVSKWEKGGDKDESDVRWAKKGEGREWDRGKILGDDGVDLKPDWA